jgi:heme exporter protein C
MAWKIFLYFFILVISVVGIAFPIVENPTTWYQYPYIPALGENAKIIFFHVPTAWLSSVAFLMSAYYSFKYLRYKNYLDDIKSYTSAQMGIIFCILATVTGAVWANFMWGKPWSWDPRQTSIFALMLIYGAFFALRSAIEEPEKKATLSAVYSLIAFVTVPFFVYIMPRLMVSLHPGSKGDENPISFKMNPNMRTVFFLSLAAFSILYYWMWSLGYRSLLIKEKSNKLLA